MKTERILFAVLIGIAGFFAWHAAMIDHIFIRYGITLGLIACIWVMIDIISDRQLRIMVQKAATQLGIITIVSAYSVTGRYSIKECYTHLESRVFFFWIPRLNVLSARTKMAYEYIEKSVPDVKVLEERWIGEYEK